jgi:hypothetical protein
VVDVVAGVEIVDGAAGRLEGDDAERAPGIAMEQAAAARGTVTMSEIATTPCLCALVLTRAIPEAPRRS